MSAHGWKLKSDFSLLSNVSFYSRRFHRMSEDHKMKKDAAKNREEQIYHGVTAFQNRQTAYILDAIADKIRQEIGLKP